MQSYCWWQVQQAIGNSRCFFDALLIMSNDLKNKMLQWESKPPEVVWNKIATSLDTDDEYKLAQRLSSFQTKPPAHAWEKIETELEAGKPARIISFYRQHKNTFKYASAAAALIMAAVLINIFVTRSPVSTELSQQSVTQNNDRRQIRSLPGTEDPSSANSDDTNSRTFPDQTVTGNTPVQESGTTAKDSERTQPNNKRGSRYDAMISEWKEAKDSLVNRYFVSTNSSGDPVKFSSKLYDLFECSEDWTEAECAQQIRLWQRKAATSAMYASADFTGVLEILKSMQEGNK